MARLSRPPLAAADILDIWDCIAEDRLDEADRWVDRLDEKLDLLAPQPLMGRARDELLVGLRSFPFGRYAIFCMAAEDGVDVVRVLHSGRDVDLAFGEGGT